MERRPLPRVAWIAWALYALVAVAVGVTYARIPLVELFHVSHGGLAGGASRVLVLLNFPVALVAVALAGIAADRLHDGTADLLAATAVILCAFVALPGVVDQADLDARWINALPAAGVGLALALTIWSARAGIVATPRLPLDRARLVLAIAALVAGIPWLLAELGVTVSDIPLLQHVFLGSQLRASPGQESLMAVHLGHHHGADGVYLTLTALLLSRGLPQLRRRHLRNVLSAYLALMLVYGAAQLVQDAWTEQVVKRGWTDHAIPSLLHPDISVWWGGMLLLAALVELAAWRRERSGGRALADPEPVQRALHLDEPDEPADER